MILCIGRVLVGIHHSMSHRMTGRKPQKERDGGWVYPLLAETTAEAELQEVETYISRRQDTVTQFIATRPVMDLCWAAERRLVSRVAKRWWEQDGLDSDGMRMEGWEAEWAEGRVDGRNNDRDMLTR